MKNKKWVLILIIAFPSFFWLILETSTINSKKLNYYGPKKVIAPKDTVFYTVPDEFFTSNHTYTRETNRVKLTRKEYPLYAIAFINNKYRNDSYRLAALWEYVNYKKDKIEHIPFVLVASADDQGVSSAYEELKKLDEPTNIQFLLISKQSMDSLNKIYFREKPYYIDYTFFVLVDPNRNIRGFYDGRYVSEIKRLTEEYKHLRLKEEKQILIDKNEIIQDNNDSIN